MAFRRGWAQKAGTEHGLEREPAIFGSGLVGPVHLPKLPVGGGS